MEDKIIAVLFSLLILAQAWGVRRLVGIWIFPACLFGLFWFAYTIIPLLVVPDAPVEPLAVGYILLCCLAYSISTVSFNWKRALWINRHETESTNYGSLFLRSTFYITTIFAVIGVFTNWLLQGFTVYDLVFNLLETSNQYMSRRYSDSLDKNLYGQIGLILIYVAAIVGGFVYTARPPREKVWHILVLALLPSVLVMLVEAAKGTLFLAAVYFWAASLVSKAALGDFRLARPSTFLRLGLCSLVIFPVVVFSFLARGVEMLAGGELLHSLWRYFVSYTSGHLYAFSDWFSSLIGERSVMYYSDDFGSHGFYTFMSIFRIFGSEKEVIPGIYDEYFYFGDILQSNIYTIYRGLIVDFGIFGSLLLVAALGFVSHLFFWRQLTRKSDVISAAFFPHAVGFIYTSFIVSLLIWNSAYISFLLVVVILSVNKRFFRDGVCTEQQ